MKLLKNISLILLGLAVAFIAFIIYETQDEINATPKNIDSRLAEYYNLQEMAGFAVAVFNGEEVFYQNAFGVVNVEKQVPYTVNTQQYVASIAKTFIGVALIKAQELGLLKLTDPVNQYLPFNVEHPNFPQQPITILQLATHTSGLAYNEQFVESLYIADSLKDASVLPIMHDYFAAGTYGDVTFLESAPGTAYEYSNIGAGLAALVVEQVTQQSFADFTQQQIFEPLAMNKTSWKAELASLSSTTNYYTATDSVTLALATNNGVQLYPCRDLYTNVIDLTKYAQAIIRRDEKLLSSDGFQQLLSPQLTSEITHQVTDNQAIFWSLDRNQYGVTYPMIGMNGGDAGINTMLWYDPYTEMGYIFIGNTGGTEWNQGNHIWIYRALVSLGDYLLQEKKGSHWSERLAYRWHNYYSRVNAIF